MNTDFLLLNASPYENGKKSGEYFRKHLDDKVLSSTPLSKHPELADKCRNSLDKLKAEYPDYYEEIIGKADGLQMERLDYYSIMCPELFNFGFEHCTTLMARKPNGHIILSHNEDDNYIQGNFCLSKVYTKEGWFVTNDMFNMPFGNGISYNSHGIVKSINYTHDESNCPDYFSRYFGQRHISEASSIDDLIKRCKEMRTASGFHVNAIDTKTLEAVSIEVYNEDISVLKLDELSVHTNHYIHGPYRNDQRTDAGSNSIFRLTKATELLSTAERTVDALKHILRYRSAEDQFDNSIFQIEKDPYITLFNFTFDTEHPNDFLLDVFIHNESLTLHSNMPE